MSTLANSFLEINALLCSFKMPETTLKCSVRVMGEMDKVKIFYIYDRQSCGFKDNKWAKTSKSIRTSQTVWQVQKMTSPYCNAAIETRKRQHDLRWNDDMTCWLRQTVQGHNINQDSTCSPEAHWYPGTGSEVNHGNVSHCHTDALICWSFRQLLCNRGGSSCRIVW